MTALKMSWSAREVAIRVSSSRLAVSFHISSQPICWSRSRRIRITPVLKPLPKAGQGLWFFQRLPRYQLLWFSTRPTTCLSGEEGGRELPGDVGSGLVHVGGAWVNWGVGRARQGCTGLTRKLSKQCPELRNVRGEGDISVQDNDSGQAERQDAGKDELH